MTAAGRPPPAPFVWLAEAAWALGKTRSRLAKAKLLAELWPRLDDRAMAVATRVLAGQGLGPAAAGQSLGPAGLLAALAAAAGQTPASLRRAQVTAGDLGEVAMAVLPARAPTLALLEVPERLAAIAALAGSHAKRRAMATLLAEATPLEARLLIKQVGGELRLGMGEGSVEDALARAFGRDKEAVRRAHMVSGDLGEVAVLARDDRLEAATLQLFRPVGAMLASPLATAMVLPHDDTLRAVEDKFDGIRVQAHVGPPAAGAAAGVALFSRGGERITGSFPELVSPLAALVGGADATASRPPCLVLDGEIVALHAAARAGPVAPFALLQRRLGVLDPAPARLAEVPVALVLFDVLVAGEALALDWPYRRRRAYLAALGGVREPLRLADAAPWSEGAPLAAAFAAARRRGNEGLMLKAQDSTYTPGRRGQAWLKVKAPEGRLDVVVTHAEVGQGRRHRWLSDVTFAVRASAADPRLEAVGRAYGGLTDAELGELTVVFRRLTLSVDGDGRRHSLRPSIVLEVLCDSVQASSRYPCGFSLRFPRIARWRRDLDVAQISTLADVARLCRPPGEGAREDG